MWYTGRIAFQAWYGHYRRSGWRDYDEIVDNTNARLDGKELLGAGDILLREDKSYWIEQVRDGHVDFLVGDHRKPDEIQIGRMTCQEFADMCRPPGSKWPTFEWWHTNPNFVFETKNRIKAHEKAKNDQRTEP